MGFDLTKPERPGKITFEILVEQRGGNPPVITEVNNPNGYAYNVSYGTPGVYIIQFTNKNFDLAKSTIYTGVGAGDNADYSTLYYLFAARFRDTITIVLYSYNLTGSTVLDNGLFLNPLFIREY